MDATDQDTIGSSQSAELLYGLQWMSSAGKYRPSFVVAATTALLASEPAFTQTDAGAKRALDEVTVTARRIEESMQDVPVSVTAFTAEGLRDRMILSTEQLDEVTPNLQFTNNTTLAGNNNSSNIFIRGVGQVDPTSTVDPGVGLYIDEVYMGQSIGGTLDLRDIARIEILRGPQGTLFGKNSVGGAIVITTVKPGDDFGGTIRAMSGTDSLVDVFGAVDLPISNTLKSRFSVGYRTQDGYVTRVQSGEDLGDTDVWTATGKLLFEPSEAFSATLSLDYSNSDENGNPFVFAASNEEAIFQRSASRDAGCPGYTFPDPVPPTDDERCANDFQAKGPFANNGTFPLTSHMTNWGASLKLRYDFNAAWSLSSITGYRELDWAGVRDADNTPLDILHTSYDVDSYQFSQELRTQYDGDSLMGTIGLFYFQDESDDIVLVELYPPSGLQRDSDNNLAESSNWALFTQWTYDFNERLSATLGGRYTEDTKASTPDQFNLSNPELKYLPIQKYEETFTNTSIMASIAYAWTDTFMTYMGYSEAFKGGGWNSHFNRPQTPEDQALFQRFGPEDAQTVEIGFKSDFAGDTVRLNGAIFTTGYRDLQFTYRVGVAPYLANAGKASIDGAELELTWVPGNWNIQAGIGYLDSSVDELDEVPSGAAIGVEVGNRLPFTPEWQYNLGLGYEALLGGWRLIPRIDWSYRSETFWDANNTAEIAVESEYSLVNASVVFGPDGAPWFLRAAAINAADELYSTGGNSSLTTGSGYSEIAYARPRQYYLAFELSF